MSYPEQESRKHKSLENRRSLQLAGAHMLVFSRGATIHSRPAHMRIRRLFEAPVPLLTELRLLMWVG